MKLLICKDTLNNNLISTQILDETDNIKYKIIENAPEIELKEGYIGVYKLDDKGNIIVEYIEKQKTEIELLREELSATQDLLITLTNQQENVNL